MSTAERIRRLLKAGQTPEQIASELGVTRQRVHVVRWHMRHPGAKTHYSRTYRARNYDAVRKRERARERERQQAAREEKRAMRVRIKQLEKELKEAKRLPRKPKLIEGPAHWYG